MTSAADLYLVSLITQTVCFIYLSFEELHAYLLDRIEQVLVGCVNQRLDITAIHGDPGMTHALTCHLQHLWRSQPAAYCPV